MYRFKFNKKNSVQFIQICEVRAKGQATHTRSVASENKSGPSSRWTGMSFIHFPVPKKSEAAKK